MLGVYARVSDVHAYARLPDEEDLMDDAKQRQHNETAWIYACKMWVTSICKLPTCLSPPLPSPALGVCVLQSHLSCAANLCQSEPSLNFLSPYRRGSFFTPVHPTSVFLLCSCTGVSMLA